jgi:hypothetical protein
MKNLFFVLCFFCVNAVFASEVASKGYCVNKLFCYAKTETGCVVSDRSFKAAHDAGMEKVIPESCQVMPLDEMGDIISQVKTIDLISGNNQKKNETTISGNRTENRNPGGRSESSSVSVSHEHSSGNTSGRVEASHTSTRDTNNGHSSSTSVSGSVTIKW